VLATGFLARQPVAQNLALSLSAVGDYVSVPDSPSLHLAASYTVEAWVKVVGGTCNPRFVCKGTGCFEAGSFDLLALGSGTCPTFAFPWIVFKEAPSQNGGPCELGGTTQVPDNASWHHVALVADSVAGVHRIYLDGILEATGGWQPAASTSEELRFGRNNHPPGEPDQLFGELDNVRIWSIARTQSEIQCTMSVKITASTISNYPGIVSVWNFEGNVSDEAGLNNGVLMGGATFVSANDIPIVASACGYCTAKVNSLGCTPTIGFTGTPSLSGPDNFHITATELMNNKPGLMLWSGNPGSSPLFGGTLCLASPIIRTPSQNSGGNPPPSDCSGSYSFFFSHAYMANAFIGPGTTFYTQYYSRDPGFPAPNNVGLTDGLRVTVGP
jgi:hypothetical protein